MHPPKLASMYMSCAHTTHHTHVAHAGSGSSSHSCLGSGVCAYFKKVTNSSAPTVPTDARLAIQTPTVFPMFGRTMAPASPWAKVGYYDVWCGNQNLIPGTDTTNTETNITWDACSSRCAARAACNYFLWGSVTYLGVDMVNRCALFVNCDTRTPYEDGNPDVYVTQRVLTILSTLATQAQARSLVVPEALPMDTLCHRHYLPQVFPMKSALVASLGPWDVCGLADGQISGTAQGGGVGPKTQSAYECNIECEKTGVRLFSMFVYPPVCMHVCRSS
jgi:hypothetical protein